MAKKLSVFLIGVLALLVCSCDYGDKGGQPCLSDEDCLGWDPSNKCCRCGMGCYERTCQEGCRDFECCFRGDCDENCQHSCYDHSDCGYERRCGETGCEVCLMSQRLQCDSSYSEDRCLEVGGLWKCSSGDCLCNCSTGNEGCGCYKHEDCGSFCAIVPFYGSCYAVYMGRCYGYEIVEPGCYCVPGEDMEFVLECYE